MFRKLAALILVANYLAIAMVGAWFHNHDPAGHAGGCHCCMATHGGPGCDNVCCHEEPGEQKPGSKPGKGSDGCPVCRFLAQKTLPVVFDAIEDSIPFREKSVPIRASQPACPFLSLPLIRGPPGLG